MTTEDKNLLRDIQIKLESIVLSEELKTIDRIAQEEDTFTSEQQNNQNLSEEKWEELRQVYYEMEEAKRALNGAVACLKDTISCLKSALAS